MATNLLNPDFVGPETDVGNHAPKDHIDSLNDASQKSKHGDWVQLCQDFLRCHRRPLNVALHIVTTPLSLFGFLAIVNRIQESGAIAVAVCYLVLVAFMVPRITFAATTAFCLALTALVVIVSPPLTIGIVALVIGYFGQESAHWLTGENTLQSKYIKKQKWLRSLIQHTLLLVPALLVIAGRRKQSPLRILVSRKAVLPIRLSDELSLDDLSIIRDWVHAKGTNATKSVHWWQSDLDDEADPAFDRLSRAPSIMSTIRRFHGTGYEVQPVLGMNELYLTGPPKKSTSDTVFYMGHVDGPWAVFPGARLYRCMLAASSNKEVTTHFPMCKTRYQNPESYLLETGDAVAFDFNRELHYITRQPTNEQTEPRVNLKLHFVAYPKSIRWYGRLLSKLTTDYDIRARRLFLNTIAPDSWWQKAKTKWVLGWTKTFELVVRYVGWTNLAYVFTVAMLSVLALDVRIFFVATSFVHYGIYAGTCRETSSIAYGVFRRNAIFYKTIAMGNLAALYCISFTGEVGDYLSLGLVVAGFGLATYATKVLGMDRTYYSAELGFDEYERIARFPYGVIPHPMILGATIGIAAMLLVPSIRQTYWWLIAAHIVCYAVILLQEISANRSRPLHS